MTIKTPPDHRHADLFSEVVGAVPCAIFMQAIPAIGQGIAHDNGNCNFFIAMQVPRPRRVKISAKRFSATLFQTVFSSVCVGRHRPRQCAYVPVQHTIKLQLSWRSSKRMTTRKALPITTKYPAARYRPESGFNSVDYQPQIINNPIVFRCGRATEPILPVW